MTRAVHSILIGYRNIFRRLLQIGAGLAALALVSALITLPIWFVATRFTALFNTIVLLSILVLFAWSVYRRRRRTQTDRSPVRIVVALAIATVFWGVTVHSAPIWITGVLVALTGLAWAQGRR